MAEYTDEEKEVLEELGASEEQIKKEYGLDDLEDFSEKASGLDVDGDKKSDTDKKGDVEYSYSVSVDSEDEDEDEKKKKKKKESFLDKGYKKAKKVYGKYKKDEEEYLSERIKKAKQFKKKEIYENYIRRRGQQRNKAISGNAMSLLGKSVNNEPKQRGNFQALTGNSVGSGNMLSVGNVFGTRKNISPVLGGMMRGSSRNVMSMFGVKKTKPITLGRMNLSMSLNKGSLRSFMGHSNMKKPNTINSRGMLMGKKKSLSIKSFL